MIAFWTLLALGFTVFILMRYKLQQKIQYWRQQNVELIDFWEFNRKTKYQPWGLAINEYYQQMRKANRPIMALEMPLISAIIVQDQQAIKDIMIKHYESFPDRGLYTNPRDSLSFNFARMDYHQWKPLRNKLTPSFTPAKTKMLFPTVLGISERLVQVLNEQCEKASKCELEIYDLCARFTTDIMGQVIFGIESNCLRHPHSEFRIHGERALSLLTNPLKDLIGSRYPKILHFFNIKVFDSECNKFFTRIVEETMDHRIKHNVRRKDFMDILMKLKEDSERKGDFSFTFDILVGQVFTLFVGGFETTSCSMAYALYELAKNQEMQEKAREEILEVLEKYNIFTYQSLSDMKYINQIMMETLRMYPILPNMKRICRRTCTVDTSLGPVTIQPGTSIVLPFYGVHHNPEHYPDPEVFRPERFTDEEILKRPSNLFLPFGMGPKNCIGEHFGKMQIVLGLAALISKFRFLLCITSPAALEFDPSNMFLLFVKDDIRLGVEKL